MNYYWRQGAKFITGSGLFVAVKEGHPAYHDGVSKLMVNPNAQQSVKLDDLKNFVLDLMLDMEVWNKTNTQELNDVKLGVLRKNATQRHGVTKWKLGSDANNLKPKILTN